MKQKLTTKEILTIAMVAAVIGVIFLAMDYAYMPLSAILGPIFMQLTFGIYLLSASLPMYLVRKPGAALLGALITAGVNLLLGSPYGIQLVLAATLQAIGIEVGYLLTKKIAIGAILASILVFTRNLLVFGLLAAGVPTVIAMFAVHLLSGAIIGTILVKVITYALLKTGALKGFACAQ